MRFFFLRDGAKDAAYDWIFVALATWLTAGVYLDGWAHNHLDTALETFFTPWHAVLYSGFGALALFCLLTLWQQRSSRGGAPHGYRLAFLGVPIFMAGGLLDMLWHVAFGVERDIEALLSPTHLILAVGAWLLVSGPLMAVLTRKERPVGWRAWLPAALSMTLSLSIVTFMLEFDHPLAYGHIESMRPLRDGAIAYQSASIGGFIIVSALLAGYVLAALRRFRWPFGTFALCFGANAALMGVIDDRFALVPGALLAGLAIDALAAWLKPSADRPAALRVLATAAPALWTYACMLGLFVTTGIWWTVHLWTGTIAISGLIGLLVSCVAIYPRVEA